MGSISLPERELRVVLEAAEWSAEAVRGDHAVADLLDAVVALVPSDIAFWNWYSLSSEVVEHALLAAPSGRQVTRAPLGAWLEHLPEHPIMSGRHGPVAAISDVLRGRDLERTWLYQEALMPVGLRYEIGLELSHRPDEMSVIVLSRGPGRDFSERDHAVLRLIRPHVDAALRRWSRPPPYVTPRERDVLRLVRDGLSNAQVARRLRLSEATVGKHLEHVYARVGVRSRTEAVLRCSDLLDGPAPTGDSSRARTQREERRG